MMLKQNRAMRALAMGLALLTALALAAPALAAANEKVTATTALNVRSGPSTRYSIIGELYKGQTVERVSQSGNWSLIQYNGATGYASSSYLKVNGGTSGSAAGAMRATTKVNIRSGPSTSYKIVGSLTKGDQVNAVGSVGNWTIIDWNGGTAYVSSTYLTKVGGSLPSPTPPNHGTKRYVVKDTALRAGPGYQYGVVSYLSFGTAVMVTDQVGRWALAEYRGNVGYIPLADLNGSAPDDETAGTAYATARLNVRSGPGSNYGVLGVLSSGESLKSTGSLGDWIKVIYGGRTGYISARFAKVLTSASATRFTECDRWMYDTGSQADAYRIPEANRTYLYGILEQYERVRCTGYNDTWSRVEADGMILYVKTELLSDRQGR